MVTHQYIACFYAMLKNWPIPYGITPLYIFLFLSYKVALKTMIFSSTNNMRIIFLINCLAHCQKIVLSTVFWSSRSCSVCWKPKCSVFCHIRQGNSNDQLHLARINSLIKKNSVDWLIEKIEKSSSLTDPPVSTVKVVKH